MESFFEGKLEAKDYIDTMFYEGNGKPPKEYLYKTKSSSVRYKNKYDFITKIIPANKGNYRVTIYKYGVLSRVSGKDQQYGYYRAETILSKDELKKYYDFPIETLTEGIKKLTIPSSQKKEYERLGFNPMEDLSYYGTGKKLYPVVSLKNYKEVLAGLSDFEGYESLSTTYKTYTLISEATPSDKYYIGYFGSGSSVAYEYGFISNSIVDVYATMQDYDYSSGVILIVNKNKKKYAYLEVYPFSDEFEDFDKYFSNF